MYQRIKGQLISHRIKIYVFQVHVFGGASLYEPLLILTLCTHISLPIFLLDTFRVRIFFNVSLTSLLLMIWQTKILMLIPHNFFWFQQNYVKINYNQMFCDNYYVLHNIFMIFTRTKILNTDKFYLQFSYEYAEI